MQRRVWKDGVGRILGGKGFLCDILKDVVARLSVE